MLPILSHPCTYFYVILVAVNSALPCERTGCVSGPQCSFFLRQRRRRPLGALWSTIGQLEFHGAALMPPSAFCDLVNWSLCTLFCWPALGLHLPLALPYNNHVGISQFLTTSVENDQENWCYTIIYVLSDYDSCGLKAECYNQS